MNFIEKLSELPVPEMIKKPKNIKIDISEIDEECEEVDTVEKKKKPQILFNKAKEKIVSGVEVVGKTGRRVAAKTEDLLRDKGVVTRQMLFYGVVKLYENGLEDFMNA